MNRASVECFKRRERHLRFRHVEEVRLNVIFRHLLTVSVIVRNMVEMRLVRVLVHRAFERVAVPGKTLTHARA